MFGFNDTYLDLMKALQIPPMKAKNYSAFSRSKKVKKIFLAGKLYMTCRRINGISNKEIQNILSELPRKGLRKLLYLIDCCQIAICQISRLFVLIK